MHHDIINNVLSAAFNTYSVCFLDRRKYLESDHIFLLVVVGREIFVFGNKYTRHTSSCTVWGCKVQSWTVKGHCVTLIIVTPYTT
jgi:hypothetical protein